MATRITKHNDLTDNQKRFKYHIIHSMYGHKIKDIQDKVNELLGTNFCLKTIEYWYKKVFHYRWLQELEEDNKIVNNWLKEAGCDDEDKEEESFIEQIKYKGLSIT